MRVITRYIHQLGRLPTRVVVVDSYIRAGDQAGIGEKWKISTKVAKYLASYRVDLIWLN
jgi:hypothetical protein